MKTKIIMMTALLALLATGCGKDNGDGIIRIFAENMTAAGNAKLQIDPTDPANSTQWLTNENIYINGTSYAITHSEQYGYYVENNNIDWVNNALYAVYPGNTFGSNVWTVDNSNLNAPVITLEKLSLKFYNKAINGVSTRVHDVVFPMGAKVVNGESSILFKHLTAGFQLDLANTSTDESVVVKKLKVLVYGAGDAEPVTIDGVSYTVKWKNDQTPALPGGGVGTVTDRDMNYASEMNFDLYTGTNPGLTIAAESSQKVCIPVTLNTVKRITVIGYNGDNEVFNISSAVGGNTGIALERSKMYPVKQIVVK